MTNKPKEIYISNDELNPEHVGSSGINIAYIKSRKVLWISGWFDGYCGIGGVEVPLATFGKLLGIEEIRE